jgi:hypothetical protein
MEQGVRMRSFDRFRAMGYRAFVRWTIIHTGIPAAGFGLIAVHVATFGFRLGPLLSLPYATGVVVEFVVLALVIGWMAGAMLWWIDKQSRPPLGPRES